MRFDGVLQRAKDRGIKLLLFQMNPIPKLHATMPDSEFTKSFGVAMALAARQFAENSKGKFSSEQVLEKMFLDVKIQATTALPKLGEQNTEEGRMRAHSEALAKKLEKDGFFEDLPDDDEGSES